MRTLYESILDDEDVLIQDTKEIANNPLVVIYEMFKNNEDQSRIIKLVEDGLLDEFLMDNFYIDRKKDLKCKIMSFGNTKNLQFNYYNSPYELIGFVYNKGFSGMDIKYMTKNKIYEYYKYTGMENSKFYKQHTKIGNNLKKLGYEKVIMHTRHFVYYTMY